MIVTLPDSFKDWIELRIQEGEYADASDYLRDLVRRDCAHLPPLELTIEEVRRIVDEARMGGVSTKTIEDIIAEGDRIAKKRGFYRD